jgi:hypothetical protein
LSWAQQTLLSSSDGLNRPMTKPQSLCSICEQELLLAKCREVTNVRREWVKTLLARKQAPKGWQYFTVHAITHHSETASGYDGKVAAEMVGEAFS